MRYDFHNGEIICKCMECFKEFYTGHMIYVKAKGPCECEHCGTKYNITVFKNGSATLRRA